MNKKKFLNPSPLSLLLIVFELALMLGEILD